MANDHTTETLAARLREAREYGGFSQEEVARYLGVSRTAISLIENGQRRVSAVELQLLAQLYQTSMESLTGHDREDAEPEAVRLVARATAALSDTDRDEVLQFVRFLQARHSNEHAS